VNRQLIDLVARVEGRGEGWRGEGETCDAWGVLGGESSSPPTGPLTLTLRDIDMERLPTAPAELLDCSTGSALAAAWNMSCMSASEEESMAPNRSLLSVSVFLSNKARGL
jgi:hypothetical protein